MFANALVDIGCRCYRKTPVKTRSKAECVLPDADVAFVNSRSSSLSGTPQGIAGEWCLQDTAKDSRSLGA